MAKKPQQSPQDQASQSQEIQTQQDQKHEPEASQTYPRILFHPEKSPDGKKCNRPEDHKGDGWVESPELFPKESAKA